MKQKWIKRVQLYVYRNLSTLEDVDVQGLYFIDDWGTPTHRKAGSDGVMCRTADGGSLFHMDTVLG